MLPTTTNLETLIKGGVKPVQYPKIENLFPEEYENIPKYWKNQYEYIEETRTYRLNELEWLRWRKHGPYHWNPFDSRYINYTLGGSDIATLYDGSELSKQLCLYNGQHGSTFKCASELYYEKKGKPFSLKEKPPSDLFWIGHNEEPSIRRLLEKKWAIDHPLDVITVYNDSHMYQCGERDSGGKLKYPFILCNLDGIVEINGVKGIFEAKTCNRNSEDYALWKRNLVPLKYYLQVCWYMLCMNLPYGIICCKWGINMDEFKYLYIERNFEIEELLIKMATDFIYSLENDIEPDLDGQSLDRLYIYWKKKMGNPIADSSPVILDANYKNTFFEIDTINTEIDSLNARIEALKKTRRNILSTKIFPNVGNASEARIPYSKTHMLSLKFKKNPKIKLNTEKLKKEQPELYNMYLQNIQSFNEKLFFKEQPELVADYLEKDNILTETLSDYCKVRFIQNGKDS